VIGQLPRKTWLEFRLVEGKNREIRRICEAFDLVIDKLRRVAIGNLTLEGLRPGGYHVYNKRKLEELLGFRTKTTDSFRSKFRSPKRTIRIKPRVIDGARVRLAEDTFFKSLGEINKDNRAKEKAEAEAREKKRS
jgi:23S rRNA pseudouridine2605 synthase